MTFLCGKCGATCASRHALAKHAKRHRRPWNLAGVKVVHRMADWPERIACRANTLVYLARTRARVTCRNCLRVRA